MRPIFALLAALVLAACEGRVGGGGRLAVRADAGTAAADDAAEAPEPPRDAGEAADSRPSAEQDSGSAHADAESTPLDTGTPPPPPDAGGCETESLAARLTLAPLPAIPRGASAFPLPAGGAAVAALDGAGVIIRAYDGAFNAAGAPITIPGDGLWGFAASADKFGALVSRDDVLALVIVAHDGTMVGEQVLMGGVPQDVVNNEWFGRQLRAGRLDWTGSEWVAYSTVQRLWPDNIAHYGDTLRTFAPDGSPAGTYWGWGCSHSMDVRLAHNAMGIGPVCSSDCFPDKGVFFMHQTTLYLDSSGNCRGYVAQELGGIAAQADGFWAGFVSGEARTSKDAAIIRAGSNFQVGPVIWLTETPEEETQLHLTNYGEGLIAAWLSGGTGKLLRLDAAGSSGGASPETIPSQAIDGASDFFVYADGDVGWVVEGSIARLRACR